MKFKTIFMKINALLLFAALTIFGCTGAPIKEKSPSGSEPVSHELFGQVLDKYVNEQNMVDYKNLKKAEPSILAEYLELLKNNHPDPRNWSENERLAYWINAYNAFTLKLVIDNYPLESIKEIGGKLKSPWDVEFIQIEDNEYSLNDIEHRIIRENYDEPRIHFAVNCASISCPVLRGEPYEADKLDKQLDEQTRIFLNDSKRNKINEKELKISKIFKWYEEDFTEKGPLHEFIAPYVKEDFAGTPEISYLDYNWRLNEQTHN